MAHDGGVIYRPVSRRIPPPHQPETYSRRRRRTKCGAPLRQPKFASAAAADFFMVRRRRGGIHELLLHLSERDDVWNDLFIKGLGL